MEDYIYILLGLVWVIYSVYRANQKKKKAKESEANAVPIPEVKEPDTEITALFDEFFNNKTPQEELDTLYENESVSRNPKAQYGFSEKDIKIDYKLDSITAEEGAGIFEENSIEDFFEKTSISEDYEEYSARDSLDFDLRKAIIYSEILNRPNF